MPIKRLGNRAFHSPNVRLFGVCFAAVVTLATSVVAQPAAAARDPGVARQHALQVLLDRSVEAGAVGAVALVDDGRGTWIGTSGLADVSSGEKLGRSDSFRVGSVTKTFVATVLLQLVDEGKVGLDEFVSQSLPGVVIGGEGITIRQLLNHTSGLYNYTDDPAFLEAVFQGQFFTPRQLVDVANSHPPLSPPGTGFSYSNTNYVVTGLVIEAVTGTALERQVHERLIRPLKLRGTGFAGVGGPILRPDAHGYVPEPDGGLLDVTTPFPHWPSWAWGAGHLVSNASDLARFYKALLAGEILRPELLASMKTTVEGSGGYGLGLFSIPTACGTVWGHSGGIPGYASIAVASEDGTRSVVGLVNLTPAPPTAERILNVVWEAAVCTALGRDRPPASSVTPPSPAVVRDALAGLRP